jgi:hypothetical protein
MAEARILNIRPSSTKYSKATSPRNRRELQRLSDEAQTIIGGRLGDNCVGAHPCRVLHLSTSQKRCRSCKTKLGKAIPGPKAPLDWPYLEELPYLGGAASRKRFACPTECLRGTLGSRAIKPMKSKSWEIPAGTPCIHDCSGRPS